MAPDDRCLPEPSDDGQDVRLRFLDYLDFYRSVVADKVEGLDQQQLRCSVLPSGWSPLELVAHLVRMERRWLVWGFLAEEVEPWGDHAGGGPDGAWSVPATTSFDDLITALHAGGRRTRTVVEVAELSDEAAVGGRFGPEDRRPTLGWIMFHVLQEYARHAGHLDVVRELLDGRVGE